MRKLATRTTREYAASLLAAGHYSNLVFVCKCGAPVAEVRSVCVQATLCAYVPIVRPGT